MKIIWPDHSQLFSMNGNVKIEQHNHLYFEAEDIEQSFWLAFGFNQFWEPHTSSEYEFLYIQGKFAKGTFIEFETKNGPSNRYHLQDGYTSMSIPLSDLLTEENGIRMIKIAGKTHETMKLEYLTISDKCLPYNLSKPNLFCITEPSWERGIWRNQEKEVCLKRGNVFFDHQLNRVEQGDVVYMRPVDQVVTLDEYVRLKTLQDSLPECKIINPIQTLYNYKLKDVTFDIWSQHDIPIPEYQIISNKKQLQQFIETHDRSIVRLNCSCSNKDTYVLSAESDIDRFWGLLIEAWKDNLEQGHPHSRLIATDKIPPTGEYHITARCYVVHGHIFSAYAYVHRMHNNDRLTGGLANTDEYRQMFVDANKKVLEWANTYKKTIAKSIKVLGLDTACVEYIVTEDGPVFLECNAFWGSGIRRNCWPHTKHVINYLNDNKDDLIDEIPNVYFRMDENKYWSTFYNLI
jgi:glutathione synthase/RimK-type ligase-like ATP-grasp enzyme